METIFKISGTLCITVYILGLLSNLVNVNYTHRAIKLTFALFLLTNVFIPLKNIKVDLCEFKLTEETSTANPTEILLEAAGKSIEQNIKTKLDANNVTYSDVNVHINNQEDGVYLDYIRISGVDADSYGYIRSLLKEEGQIIFGD